MCNIRAYKHGCGHLTTHFVSACRGTYACPRSEKVLCHAAPSLTVKAPEQCRACQWASFSRLWDTRIAESQAKLSVATQVQMELQEDWVEADMSTAVETNDFGAADRAAERLNAAKCEVQRAQSEVDILVSQYKREKRQKWRPSLASLQTAGQKPPKQRNPTPRQSGLSPLKESQSIDEVAYERQAPDEDMKRRWSFESISSEGSAPELSDSGDISPPESPPGSPRCRPSEFSFDLIGTSWSKEMGGAPAVMDEEEEDLLPNFGGA